MTASLNRVVAAMDTRVARTEVNISPKISISAQPLKMALHKNPAMHGSRIAIFLHEDKKEVFLHDYKLFFCTIQK